MGGWEWDTHTYIQRGQEDTHQSNVAHAHREGNAFMRDIFMHHLCMCMCVGHTQYRQDKDKQTTETQQQGQRVRVTQGLTHTTSHPNLRVKVDHLGFDWVK